jgi:DHA2 family multidrug resistance protein
VTVYSGGVQERMQSTAAFFMSQGSDPYSAHMRAIGAIGSAVRRQDFLLAYSNCFLALGFVLLSSTVALFFMKKARIVGAASGH